ncbi:MAG: DinB family protein [Gemmatimonadota bacterium]|nr:DinB family protein [Gemmatimonadota bacterium]
MAPDSSPSDAATRLVAQWTAILRVIGGARAGDLDRRPPSNKWSAREHLAHLGRYHEVFLDRIARIRREDRPRFERYRAEDDPEFAAWLALDARAIAERTHALRADLIAVVLTMTRDEWLRAGVHPAFGEMPLSEWLEFFLAHDGHHQYVMFQRIYERGGA